MNSRSNSRMTLLQQIIILVTILWASAAWDATLTLNWVDNSDNEDGFKIDRKLTQTGPWAEIGQVGPNITTFADNVTDQQLYCYRVKAFNNAGDSPASNEACATTLTTPLAPGTITITITNP